MEKEELLRFIEREKLIAVVRGVEPEKCVKVADALYAGGFRLVEVTFDQKNPDTIPLTQKAIAAISEKYHDSMPVGAGTVMSVEQVVAAAEAGAKYIVSPDMNREVIRLTHKLGLVSIPGVMTPSEIMIAHEAGADFVKLFPVSVLGCDYIKAVRAPISNVRILAVGGVDEDNVSGFLKAGACGAGVGGNLVNKTWIENNEYDKITAKARGLVLAAKSA